MPQYCKYDLENFHFSDLNFASLLQVSSPAFLTVDFSWPGVELSPSLAFLALVSSKFAS